MLKEFREFAMRGNVVDLAVGVIIGGAFGKIVTALTLYFGAYLVIDGNMTIGELIAFNMLAGRVATPVMRLAQLWTDFQQTGISVQRLGDILNTRTEVPPANASQLPPLKGRVQFEGVRFRYRPEAPPCPAPISQRISNVWSSVRTERSLAIHLAGSWKLTRGSLRPAVISSAASTSCRSIRDCIDQPITCRENKSNTTAKYSQPS